MRGSDFKEGFGKIIISESKKYGECPTFVPDKLPPKFHHDREIINALYEAGNALGELRGAGSRLPNPDLFFRFYIKKESASSSRIEGIKDVESKEVGNYEESMEYALEKIKKEPISKNLIKKMHEILMKGTKECDSFPGEFKHGINWIGEEPPRTKFTPPPPEEVERLIDELIDYMDGDDETPLLIKCALMHYQFETIHPFSDGNGRIGRLLITLYLCKKREISGPLLDVSGYFEKYRRDYGDLLLETNKTGRFENWIKFFLEAIKIQSKDALKRTNEILDLREIYGERTKGYRQTNNLLKVVDLLFILPFIQINWIKDELKITYPTAKKIVDDLVELEILEFFEKDGREKVFVAKEIMETIHYDSA